MLPITTTKNFKKKWWDWDKMGNSKHEKALWKWKYKIKILPTTTILIFCFIENKNENIHKLKYYKSLLILQFTIYKLKIFQSGFNLYP